MLSRVISRLFNAIFANEPAQSEPTVDNFRPHPSWLMANQLHRDNAERVLRQLSHAQHEPLPPPRGIIPTMESSEIHEENLGLTAMDLSDGMVSSEEDEPVESQIDAEVQEDASSDSEELPKRLQDCVTLEPFKSPVTSRNGHTYERQTLKDLATMFPGGESLVCPLSRQPIELEAITYQTNLVVKEEIAERLAAIEARKRQREKIKALKRESAKKNQAPPPQGAEDEVRVKRIRFFEREQQMVTQPPSYDNISCHNFFDK